MEKVRCIQAKLVAIQSQEKEYMDNKERNINFNIGEKVIFNVSPMKGVIYFDKGKFSLRYISTFEVFKGVGSAVYKLVLPPSSPRVHAVFHVSMLKEYHKDRVFY